MAESICPKCNKALLEECDGRGTIFVDIETNRTKDCPRMYLQQLKEHLGPILGKVEHHKNSALYQLGAPKEEPVDLTKSNIFIRNCKWHKFQPHLKWVLICKGLKFKYKVIEDRQIRDVFVGGEQYNHKAKSLRDEIPTYNNLAAMVSDYLGLDLVIIHLGTISYKNIAAPGALKEIIQLLVNQNKPVWVVDNGEWAFSKDADVEEYLKENFEEVYLEDQDPAKIPQLTGAPKLELPSAPVKFSASTEIFEAEYADVGLDASALLPGGAGSESKYKKKAWKPFKDKGNRGGPV